MQKEVSGPAGHQRILRGGDTSKVTLDSGPEKPLRGLLMCPKPDPTRPCTFPQPSLSVLTCEMRTNPPYLGGWLPGSREETGAVTALWEEGSMVTGTTRAAIITAIFLGLLWSLGWWGHHLSLCFPTWPGSPIPSLLGSLKLWHPQLQP